MFKVGTPFCTKNSIGFINIKIEETKAEIAQIMKFLLFNTYKNRATDIRTKDIIPYFVL